jgi:hypothetical protein
MTTPRSTHPTAAVAAIELVVFVALASACSNLPTDLRDRALSPSSARSLLSSAAATTAALPIVTRVDVKAVSGSMDVSTWTIVVGGTEQFKATGYDLLGQPVSNTTATYRSTDTTVLKVNAQSGLATAAKAGSASIVGTINGISGTSKKVTVQAAPPPPPPPTGSSSIPLSVMRFDGLSGPATVSAGVPLKPGLLQPGQEGLVRLVMGGVELKIYAKGLSSLHPDGSLRAVLVQFQLPALGASQAAAATLTFAATRPAALTQSTPFVTPGASAASTPGGLPQAAALPTDPAYLLTTDLVGPTTSTAATKALGGDFARYETDFVQYAEALWSSESDSWNPGNYYDRALIYYAMWARTGNPTYWARAGRIAYQYRVGYLEANAYNSSPHWAQLEGLEKHYLLTGDDKSRTAVLNTAYTLNYAFLNTSYMTSAEGESRIAARVLHSQLLAWRLTPTGSPSVTFRGQNMSTFNWRAAVESALDKIAAWQQPDGSYPSQQVCGGQLNYMVGMLNDALIKTADYYLPTSTTRAAMQARVRTLVQKAVDYLWTTQWRPADRSFNYASVDCSASGVGGMTAAPDLNNMISAGVAWVYKQTGVASYRTNADAVFANGVEKAFVSGTKQFNQEYTSSFRYLGYR